MTIGIILLVLVELFAIMMVYRNAWVYKKRIAFLDQAKKYNQVYDFENVDKIFDEFHNLPDYDIMLWKFWIWDFEKFRKH